MYRDEYCETCGINISMGICNCPKGLMVTRYQLAPGTQGISIPLSELQEKFLSGCFQTSNLQSKKKLLLLRRAK
jgi:hypothetical protein